MLHTNIAKKKLFVVELMDEWNSAIYGHRSSGKSSKPVDDSYDAAMKEMDAAEEVESEDEDSEGGEGDGADAGGGVDADDGPGADDADAGNGSDAGDDADAGSQQSKRRWGTLPESSGSSSDSE
jgi:hypothetical protein